MKNISNKKAFTLIEVVVAVGLFSIVMMVALAIILSVVDNNKKVHSVNVVVDNLNFAIDSMVRDIKTGKFYQCGTSPTINIGGGSGCESTAITLVSTLYDKDKIVQYEFSNGKIFKSSCDISATNSNDNQVVCSGNTIPTELTSSEINITEANFVVNPGSPGISQPTVFVLIKGTSAINPTEASDFTIQTLISQRYLNI
jgi:prepilin-type N-terminal cleavage/methylation domain-containing protein